LRNGNIVVANPPAKTDRAAVVVDSYPRTGLFEHAEPTAWGERINCCSCEGRTTILAANIAVDFSVRTNETSQAIPPAGSIMPLGSEHPVNLF
jgi:hypothetical protein